MSKNFNVICAVFRVANQSRASTNDSTKSPGVELPKNIGCSIKLNEMDTDIGIFLPIHVVVSVFLIFSPAHKLIEIRICHVFEELLVIRVKDI